MAWTPIPPERAKTHPLFGIRGWLLLYVISTIIGMAQILLITLQSNHESPSQKVANFAIATIFLAMQLLVLYFLFRHSPRLRVVALWTIAASILLGLAMSALLSPPDLRWIGLVVGLVVGLVPSIAWAIYFQRSRRVRVTFEHLVRDNDPLLQAKK